MHNWLLAFHIVGVVCWFAALFYLPRLFVYHVMASDHEGIERFKVMERKLYRGIANPSMMASVALGIAMVWQAPGYYFAQHWFVAKVALVAVLLGYHFMCKRYLVELRDDRCNKSHRYFRFFNEVPVLFLVAIVILVVVKPF